MVVDSTQKVSQEKVDKMKEMGLYSGTNSSFDKSLHLLITFCEKNKKQFQTWKKKLENQQKKSQ